MEVGLLDGKDFKEINSGQENTRNHLMQLQF